MKEMTRMLEDTSASAAVTDTRWSAFGRVDLVETDNPLFKTLFIDGAAGTKMISMPNGTVSRELAETLLYQYMGGVPLLAVDDSNKDRALVIGSGGGIDVVTLLLAGYADIDAVEINPDFIRIVKEQESYNGGIYTSNPRITLIEGEGRSFIRSVDHPYDLILMSLPITKSARNYGNQALTENYLFTSHAFGEYLQKLTPEGYIVIVAHYPNELIKITVNAAAALMSSGLSLEEAMQRIVTIGTDSSPALVLKASPFSPEEANVFYAIMTALGQQGTTNFIPGMPQQSRRVTLPDGREVTAYELNPGLVNLADGNWTLEDLNANSSENVGIVTDNSPFFYQMSKTLPSEVAEVAVIAALLLAAVGTLFLVKGKIPGSLEFNPQAVRQFVSFTLIGIGYMTVEIALLQKFILYWQHQTLALAAALSIVLVSSGAGSYLSARFTSRRRFPLILVLLTAVLALGPLYTERLIHATASASSVVKLLVTAAAAAPPFFLMGMPFPILLEKNQLLRNNRTEYPWMIGINSIASLAGGVFSMVIALSTGYHMVMAAGIACYAALLLITLIDNRLSS
jgi:spermidine synthase